LVSISSDRKELRNQKNKHKPRNDQDFAFGFAFSTFVSVAIIALVLGIIFYKPEVTQDEEIFAPIVNDTETPDLFDDIPEPEPIKVKLERDPSELGSHFFESQPIIDEQQAYIAYPLEYPAEQPPTVVIYSHGSDTSITDDLETDFMKDMREYGVQFTKAGYVFAASNQHGENWGNDESLQDMLNLMDWFPKNDLEVAEAANLIGFSMGGLPTLNFASAHPELVERVALLAPTTRSDLWETEFYSSMKNLIFKVWHGTQDVNINLKFTRAFVEEAQEHINDIAFIEVEGASHFDIDTELIPDIIDFFTQLPEKV